MYDLGLANVNWIAVVIAAVINMAVGFVWYSKALFAVKWMKLVGKKEEDLKAGPGIGYLWATLASLVIAFALSFFINLAGATNFMEGAWIGLLAAVGFVVTSEAAQYVFEGRPRDLYLINVGYNVVSFVLMGAVIAYL